MPDFPHISDVRAAASERMRDYLRHEPLVRELIEQKLPKLLEHSDFGTIEAEADGMTYVATVNRKKICDTSGWFNVEVDGVAFTITVDKGMMMATQARQDGVGPKWKL